MSDSERAFLFAWLLAQGYRFTNYTDPPPLPELPRIPGFRVSYV